MSLGGGVDIDFGEMLDCLLLDRETDSILLYVESVRDARRFLSALRAAARTKPVDRAARPDARTKRPRGAKRAFARTPYSTRRCAVPAPCAYERTRNSSRRRASSRSVAFRAATGSRSSRTAAARRFSRLTRLPSATSALAAFDPATLRTLERCCRPRCERSNPVDVRADAPPERIAECLAAVLADANVDAAVVLHVPRPSIGAGRYGARGGGVARDASKPVLAAWLGAIDRPEVREALEAGGMANFYTPENAVEAFSFLAAYRRHQDGCSRCRRRRRNPMPPDLAAARQRATRGESDGRTPLTAAQSTRLLGCVRRIVMPAARSGQATRRSAAARRLGYPVSLEASAASRVQPLRREDVRDARAVVRA